MLDSIVYEFEYLDENNALLAENCIDDNLFSQVDGEGDIFVLFDEIVYHCVGGTDTIQWYTFIFQII